MSFLHFPPMITSYMSKMINKKKKEIGIDTIFLTML